MLGAKHIRSENSGDAWLVSDQCRSIPVNVKSIPGQVRRASANFGPGLTGSDLCHFGLNSADVPPNPADIGTTSADVKPTLVELGPRFEFGQHLVKFRRAVAEFGHVLAEFSPG